MKACMLVAMLMLAGCDTSVPSMGRQPSAKTGDPSGFFADGASARPAIAGTVPQEDEPIPAVLGAMQAVSLDAPNPLPLSRANIERGQLIYNVNCSPCHSRLGTGLGMIVQRGFTRPPSYHSPRLKRASDAHFYNVMTLGFGAMYSYADRVSPGDRWAVIAYIRALQRLSDDPAMSETDRAVFQVDYDPNAARRANR